MVGVIFRLQGRKIGPTVRYFPSVQTENNMHTHAILRPYERKINATICCFLSYGRKIAYGYILPIFHP